MIEIWQPRWKDRKVLVAKYKVGTLNKIVFTKAKAYEGMTFILQGKDIATYPIEDNGKISCYAVPLNVVLDGKESTNTEPAFQ
jgi:hypothetical protein